MASPRILIQIVTSGTRIIGKAMWEAGRQAVKNAKTAPPGGAAGDASGVGHARSGSLTDQLTRQYRMTLDEAHLILNTKRDADLEKVLQHYEHLFKANSPPTAPAAKTVGGKAPRLRAHSHYIQSKVYRARERIEAELKGPEVPPTTPPGPNQPPASSTPNSSTTGANST